jgi:anti-sigma regulatory factor (Ser/Thr protein kinase)
VPTTKEIRGFLLDNVRNHPKDLVTFAAEHFGISRQAIHRHVQGLIEDRLLVGPDSTRGSYALRETVSHTERYPRAGLQEHKVLHDDFLPLLTDLPENVCGLFQYGVSEMINNAIDHSGGERVTVSLHRTAREVWMFVQDDGVGIFAKVKQAFGLDDERHAMLELSKGKLTTDPANHTGQGIFFSSRMFDRFVIDSGKFVFIHTAAGDALFEDNPESSPGTLVQMRLNLPCVRTIQSVFDTYSTTEHDDVGFSRTILFVQLGKYEGELLVSRSQAKRLLARMERFREVMLDFTGIDTIGQAFADEIFRVFPATHPGVRLVAGNTSPAVQRMIAHVTAEQRERELRIKALEAQAESLQLQLRQSDSGAALMGPDAVRLASEAQDILRRAQQEYDADPDLFRRTISGRM